MGGLPSELLLVLAAIWSPSDDWLVSSLELFLAEDALVLDWPASFFGFLVRFGLLVGGSVTGLGHSKNSKMRSVTTSLVPLFSRHKIWQMNLRSLSVFLESGEKRESKTPIR